VCGPVLIFASTKLKLARIFDLIIQQVRVKFMVFWKNVTHWF